MDPDIQVLRDLWWAKWGSSYVTALFLAERSELSFWRVAAFRLSNSGQLGYKQPYTDAGSTEYGYRMEEP